MGESSFKAPVQSSTRLRIEQTPPEPRDHESLICPGKSFLPALRFGDDNFDFRSDLFQSYDAFMHDLTISLQALVAASIVFVWVVRYDNIVQEFNHFGLPDWLRDLVGVLKMTFALMLLIGIERGQFAVYGGIGIAVLMAAAMITHLRVKNPLLKMLPSMTLLICSVAIAWINVHLRS